MRAAVALSAATFMAGCPAAQPSETAGGGAMDTLPLCASPREPGCAECCAEHPGPGAAERSCSRRRAAAQSPVGARLDYAEQAELLPGPCPTTCRLCAACTDDRRKTYERLLAKKCDCLDPLIRETAAGIDPCYSGGCGCICSQFTELSECGPPF